MIPELEDPERVRTLLDRPVQVVAGKGGVGRTTLAVALALRASRAGQRTLLLEVDAPDSATRALGADPAPDTPREIENQLWVCRMTPPGALKEYALLVLRFRLLYRIVFENDLVKYLLRSIPSLAEVTMLGKAWWHATQDRRNDGRLRFERVIIDAPATGHAVTFLSVARVVADVAPAGVMKDQAEEMARMVEDAIMHVVALPEEMPVTEGLELFGAVPERLRIGKGLAILNRMTPGRLRPDDAAVL
ncbi:MAG: ArsA-related P-loop ATPase, partial [Myxococcota bacterium]